MVEIISVNPGMGGSMLKVINHTYDVWYMKNTDNKNWGTSITRRVNGTQAGTINMHNKIM